VHFPKAKFLHIVRDGRAVFASKKKARHSKTNRPFETSPVRAAEIWTDFVLAFDAFRKRHPQGAFEVSYERLLEDLSGVCSEIFRFLEVEPDPSVAARARESLEPSYVVDRSRHLHANVASPPRLERIDAWREELSNREIRAYETVASRALEAKGYPIVTDGRDRGARWALRLRRSARGLRRWIHG
jgi:hypothetical protein